MTYTELRAALSDIARWGELSGHAEALRGLGFLRHDGQRWGLTALGWTILGERPASHHTPRRTPAIGHAAHHLHSHHHDVRKLA